MKLFVYGSLQHPLVWQQLIGRACEAQPAVLSGWQAVKVKNEDYPGLIPADEHCKVLGIIKSGLSAADFAILDKFEGQQYQRIQLVITNSQAQQQQAYVYVFKKTCQEQLTTQIWRYQEFSQQGLQRFLNRHL